MKKNDVEKPLLVSIILVCVVKLTTSPKKYNINTEVNNTINPAFLLGTALSIAYWQRKYHSGTICNGVSKAHASNALSGCDNVAIPKWHCKKYNVKTTSNPKKSFTKMNGKNGTLLFVFILKGLFEECKWR